MGLEVIKEIRRNENYKTDMRVKVSLEYTAKLVGGSVTRLSVGKETRLRNA
jgi:hypothetical protein